LWRYASYLMTGGVQAAKRERRHGYVAFRPPSLWRRMGQTRKARSIRDSAARKIGRHCHVSLSFARSELMDFVGMLLRNKKSAPQLAAQLELTAEEVALLLGSSPGTKKVQGIIDEAVRIQSREQIEKIELAWRKSGQAADDPGANGPEGRDGPSKRDGQARAERKNGSEPAPSPEKRQKSLFDF